MKQKYRHIKQMYTVFFLCIALTVTIAPGQKSLTFKKLSNDASFTLTEDGVIVTNLNIVEGNNASTDNTDLLITRQNDNKVVLSAEEVKIAGSLLQKQSNFCAGLRFKNTTKAPAEDIQASSCENGDFCIRGEKFIPFNGRNPNYVRLHLYQKPSEKGEIITTNYWDGLMRKIEGQVRLNSSRTLVSGNYYDEIGRTSRSVKAYAENGSLSYYPMTDINGSQTLIDAANNYYKTLTINHAYSEIQYFEDPLSRTHAIGLPGEPYSLDQDHYLKIWYFGIPEKPYPPGSQLHDYLDEEGFIISTKLNYNDLESFNSIEPDLECEYYLQVQKDPDGNYNQIMIDKFGNSVKTWAYAQKDYSTQ